MAHQALEIKIAIKHKLALTPELKQSLGVLKMGIAELAEHIKEVAKENPVMEVTEKEQAADISFKMGEKSKLISGTYFDEGFDASRLAISPSGGLREHLLLQLDVSDIDKKYYNATKYIIENIDRDGYLDASIEEISEAVRCSLDDTNKALEFVQSFEPSGVGALDIKECIILQLKAKKKYSENIIRFCENHFEDLIQNKVDKLSTSTGIDKEKLYKLSLILRSLDKKPGRKYSKGESIAYVSADIVVKNDDGKLSVYINEQDIPVVGISSYYEKMLKNSHDAETVTYLEEKIKQAKGIIESIEQRKATLRNIAEEIISIQRDFLMLGLEYLRPMTMKQLAEDVGVHESTISRAVSGKYIKCDWGNFELISLFSKEIVTEKGERLSNKSVMFFIKELIDDEDKREPLSDQKITEILNERGIPVARRTVAKYRNKMYIPSSVLRRVY